MILLYISVLNLIIISKTFQVAIMNANGRGLRVAMISEQCARWQCYTRTPGSDYCYQSCLKMATVPPIRKIPILMPIPFCLVYHFYVAKIWHSLKAKRKNGVPHFSQDLFKIPPWKSGIGLILFSILYYMYIYYIIIFNF